MDVLSQFHRHSLLVSIYIARTDDHHDVRRVATLLWKEKLQSGPKAKAEILPLLLAVLKALQAGDCEARRKAAERCLAELEAGDKADFDSVEAQKGAAGVLFAQDANDIETLDSECKAMLMTKYLVHDDNDVNESVDAESRTRQGAEAALEEELRPLVDKPLLDRTAGIISLVLLKQSELPKDGVEDEASEEEQQSKRSSDSLIFLDGLRMMYGGGHMLLKDAVLDLRKGRRYGVVGRNGAGKTTLMSTIAAGGVSGMTADVKTLHVKPEVLVEASDLNAVQFCRKELKNQEVEDDEMQEVLKRRSELARKYGKYGFEVESIQSRVVRGNEVLYEVQWKGCDDPKQNTFENLAKLKKLDVVGLAKAYDERLAAQAAGIDQRPLTQKEIVKHLEQFGLDEDMILHREIGGFSAGQKSKLTLGAAFWTKPHIIALDEPTNYIDMETLDALVQGLARYKGGIIVISHASEFVNQVCNEIWKVEGGVLAEKTKRTIK
eukprot:Skav234427  [mRNA]  locus=scaffold1656:160413:170895:- [translate_table: standard]